MRRGGSAVALLGLLLLTSCAITPPVLGGPFPDGAGPDEALTEAGLWTDEGVAALLILNDPDSPPNPSSAADYRAAGLDAAPDAEPPACRAGLVPLLLLDGDEQADGTVFEPPTLFRDAPGADLLVRQVARRFGSAVEADGFADELRGAREACPAFATADGSTVEQEIVDGDFGVRAVGVATRITSSDGAAIQTFEWVLVAGNVAISLTADLLDEDASATLDDLAEEYAERLER